ncbi:NAD(P)-dependent oxidoreductase [Streptomyces griseiscabiei]|uniref:SDR family oxidoreductase n=1 Tax=Streptomyces griseiscabiei TaxID=2993540 RepID=A0ABU4L3J2_9ACTN|nr:NAD(P)-binding oxidoreductase [Streptomyces griseiscabiei]MBZ3906035.1 SDR family oxidoreductase [Streptomyces griseiscabiei]MDX2909668.1 SDR family oxidoreductase [Streptomyces griseiscabiei]
MKLLVLGATGPTGRHVIDAALRSGDTVTALVRDPAALGDLADRITLVTGDATSHRDIAGAAAGQDAVISALGRGNSVRADGLFTRSSAAVVTAARETDVARLIWLSSFGVGHTYDWSSTTQKAIYSTLLRGLYANKEIADEAVRGSGLDWTVVYPTRLTDGAAKGGYQVADRLPMKGNPTISRADVAAFMHQAAHGVEWIRRSPVISD